MSNNINTEYCGVGKRILAFILDLLIVVLIAINLNNYIFTPLFKDSLGTTSLEEQYKNRLIESHLYFDHGDGYLYTIDNANNNSSMNNEEFIEYLDYQLALFYSDSDFECSNMEYYNNLKNENPTIFEYNTSTLKYEYKDNVSDEEILNFYIQVIDISINEILIQDKQINETLNKIIVNNATSLMMSIIVSMVIFFLIIPLISKNGSTIGKYLLKIGVIDLKSKMIAHKGQIALRFVILLIECLLSLMCYGGVLLISLAITIFSKNNSSIHDLICKTTLVDLKQYNLPPIDLEEGELACQ